MEASTLTPENAAAELYARSLDKMGVIDTAWRKRDSNAVCATTHGGGLHLLNQARDFDADVHLICETEQVADAGNLPGHLDREDHGTIFFNVTVHGVKDDASGYGFPTHIAGRDGASQREDISPNLRRIAEAAGVGLD